MRTCHNIEQTTSSQPNTSSLMHALVHTHPSQQNANDVTRNDHLQLALLTSTFLIGLITFFQ